MQIQKDLRRQSLHSVRCQTWYSMKTMFSWRLSPTECPWVSRKTYSLHSAVCWPCTGFSTLHTTHVCARPWTSLQIMFANWSRASQVSLFSIAWMCCTVCSQTTKETELTTNVDCCHLSYSLLISCIIIIIVIRPALLVRSSACCQQSPQRLIQSQFDSILQGKVVPS